MRRRFEAAVFTPKASHLRRAEAAVATTVSAVTSWPADRFSSYRHRAVVWLTAAAVSRVGRSTRAETAPPAGHRQPMVGGYIVSAALLDVLSASAAVARLVAGGRRRVNAHTHTHTHTHTHRYAYYIAGALWKAVGRCVRKIDLAPINVIIINTIDYNINIIFKF